MFKMKTYQSNEQSLKGRDRIYDYSICWASSQMSMIKQFAFFNFWHITCSWTSGSAFNAIIPQCLADKLGPMGLNTPPVQWAARLPHWQITVSAGQTEHLQRHHSKHSAHQGCFQRNIHYSLFTLITHDCLPRCATNHIVKLADDTTVVGLIRDDNDLANREEVEQLMGWTRDNSLILNVDKTKEIMVDFRNGPPTLLWSPTARLWRWSTVSCWGCTSNTNSPGL